MTAPTLTPEDIRYQLAVIRAAVEVGGARFEANILAALDVLDRERCAPTDDAPEEECRTPGAIYSITVSAPTVTVVVTLPPHVEIDEKLACTLEDRLHRSVEHVLSDLFGLARCAPGASESTPPNGWDHDTATMVVGPGYRCVEFVHPHGQTPYFSCRDPDGEQADIDVDVMTYMVRKFGAASPPAEGAAARWSAANRIAEAVAASPGFRGQLVTHTAIGDARHELYVCEFAFEAEAEVYVVAADTHEGGGTPTLMPLAAVVHVLQNVTSAERWELEGREPATKGDT